MSRDTREVTTETHSTAPIRRRPLLCSLAGLVGAVGLAGCSSRSDGDSGSEDGADPGDGSGSDGGSASSGAGSTGSDGSAGTGRTGEEARSQVSRIATVYRATGRIGSEGSAIDRVSLSLRLPPGVDTDVDLTQVAIQYVSDSGVSTVVHDDVADPDQPAFTTRAISAAQPGNAVLTDPADRYEIRLPLGQSQERGGDTAGVAALDPGQSAELTVTFASGGEQIVVLVVPDSLGSPGSTVEL